MRRLFVFTLMCAFLPSGAFAAVTYSYDEQSRLTQARYTDGGTVSFAYDATGNRLNATVTASAAAAPAAGGGSVGGTVVGAEGEPAESGSSRAGEHRPD